jgi:pyruvate dehydrogenase E1 component beta subunit
VLREGSDLTIISTAVGVHRGIEAAQQLESDGISASVVDLRTISPLDRDLIYREVRRTGRLLVLDEDYESFGLSGELAAVVLEAGLSIKYARVCTRTTIPYAREREDQVLPNVERIITAAHQVCS